MLRKSIKDLWIIALVLLILTGCDGGKSERQYIAEIDSLKKEVEYLKDNLSKNDQMQRELDSLINEVESLKQESSLEASVYSQISTDKDIIITIDFKKEANGADRNIYFIVLSGNLQGQIVSNGSSVAVYDETIIPGKGTLGTDDVPKDVTRYQVSFPTRSDYVFNIIAIEQSTGRLWQREIYNNDGDI